MSDTKILTVVGARPQFIKAAAVSRALRQARLREVMVHTGQHFDPNMSDIFFRDLDIPAPAHHLDINGGGHGEMTGRMLAALEVVMMTERPDWVVVYGDTNSTLAGALAAAKLHLPVAHVEAGLRSFNRRMPEEINRVVTDHLSALLLCPTGRAVQNLTDEGIRKGVHNIGDVMYDATIFAIGRAKQTSNVLDRHGLKPGSYAVVTIHRAENTDDHERLTEIVRWLEQQANELEIVFPLHPRTRAALKKFGLSPRRVRLLPPLGYLDMSRLVAECVSVYTDSGGLQKEAYFHGKPCVTLREETEWVETISNGWNRLWREPHYAPRRPIADYGKGEAAAEVARLLAKYSK